MAETNRMSWNFQLGISSATMLLGRIRSSRSKGRTSGTLSSLVGVTVAGILLESALNYIAAG